MHLLIGKEKSERGRALHGLLRNFSNPITHFYPETFTVDLFFQEVETPPFLSSSKGVIVHEIDRIAAFGEEIVFKYLEKPSPWITLFLTASELSPQNKISKLIAKKGSLHHLKEEKPWEKERRLIGWLIEEAKRQECFLSFEGGAALIQGTDHVMLEQELHKLICYVGERKKIDLKDIEELSTPAHHDTLWQLGEALMSSEILQALQIAHHLLEEGIAIFPLLAHIRSQFTTGIEILQAAEQGEIAQKFPYLKGKILDKKLNLLKKWGERASKSNTLDF